MPFTPESAQTIRERALQSLRGGEWRELVQSGGDIGHGARFSAGMCNCKFLQRSRCLLALPRQHQLDQSNLGLPRISAWRDKFDMTTKDLFIER